MFMLVTVNVFEMEMAAAMFSHHSFLAYNFHLKALYINITANCPKNNLKIGHMMNQPSTHATLPSCF